MFSFTTFCVLLVTVQCVTSQSSQKEVHITSTADGFRVISHLSDQEINKASNPKACSQGEKCVSHYQCPEMEAILENLPGLVSAGEFLENISCSSEPFPNVAVCCKSPSTNDESSTETKPENVYEITEEDIAVLPLCDCGIAENATAAAAAAAGETTQTIEQIPWLVQIREEGTSDPALLCGGTLISSRYVLTAAHCSRTMGAKVNVIVGTTDAKPSNEHIIEVQETIRHPDYNSESLEHDISLLYLAKAVTFSNKVRPICLLTKNLADIDEYTVVGWGSFTNKNNVVSRELIAIPDLRPWTTQQCSDVVTSRPITDHNVCLIGYTPAKLRMNSTQCTGACGGPLTQLTAPDADSLKCPKPRPAQVQAVAGVLSAGPNVCMMDGNPSIFMSVPKYVPWILQEMKTTRKTFDDVKKYINNLIDKLNT